MGKERQKGKAREQRKPIRSLKVGVKWLLLSIELHNKGLKPFNWAKHTKKEQSRSCERQSTTLLDFI